MGRSNIQIRKEKAPVEKEKPAWSQQKLLKGGGKPKAPWEDKGGEKKEKKPEWAAGGGLKKTEKKETGADHEERKRKDWRDQLQKSGGAKA